MNKNKIIILTSANIVSVLAAETVCGRAVKVSNARNRAVQ